MAKSQARISIKGDKKAPKRKPSESRPNFKLFKSGPQGTTITKRKAVAKKKAAAKKRK